MKERLKRASARTWGPTSSALSVVSGSATAVFVTWHGDNPGLGLLIGFTAVVVGMSAVHSILRRQHAHMVVLDLFSAGLGESVVDGDPVEELLRRTHELYRADWTWLIFADGITINTTEYDGASVSRGLAQTADQEIMAHLSTVDGAPSTLHPAWEDQGPRRVRHVLAALMPSASGGRAALVVGRRNRWEQFRPPDVSMFARIALHGGTALQSGWLVHRLRSESASNRHQADHDALTGLANRVKFRNSLQEVLRSGALPGVLLIDLDRFKEVNDTLGHHNGDLLLAEAAMRMQHVLGSGTMLARLGGDEFAAYLDADGDETRMRIYADDLRYAMTRPFKLGDVHVDVGASIGIALVRPIGDSVGEVLRRADVAMYAAKVDRTGVEIYREAFDGHSPERLQIIPRLRSAIERRELVLHFQPQLDLRTGRIVGAETLIRWPAAGTGFIAPDDFLPAAEQTDLMRPLTRFVLEEAILQCGRWREEGHDLRVSVNVSARNLLEPDLAAFIASLLDRAGIPHGALRVELTETALVTRAAETAGMLQSLRDRGIGVALDDFGTGHSSLTHLTTLPVDEVKIDKSFVLALGIDPVAGRVAQAIIELGASLGLDVVAEGVESAEHAESLAAMGCTHAQGYFFAKPMSPGDFVAWLGRHRQWTSTRVATSA